MKFCLKSLSLLCVIIAVSSAAAQTAELGAAQGQGTINMKPYGMMTEVRPASNGPTGSTYMIDDWSKGKIDFSNGQVLDNAIIRYNILTNQIEVKIDEDLKGVSGKQVKSFTYFNQKELITDVFVSGTKFKEDSVQQTGFFKVIASGEWSLFEKTEIIYVKPNYNEAMGVGNREGSYVKRSKLYMAHGTSLFQIPRSKKTFLKSFQEPTENLAAFMKEKKLTLKEKEDLQLIVDFLNKKS